MGTALALRLVATGHQVTVWNRTTSRTAEAVAGGATAAPLAAEAVGASPVTLVSMADDAAVRSLVDSELAAALGDDRVLVDTSTVSPATTRALADVVGHQRMLAAPLLGAPFTVEAGKATLLLGGPSELIDRLTPLWADIGAGYHICGQDPGAATSLKLVSNYLLLGGLAVLSEAVATAEAAGIDPDVLRSFLQSSPQVAGALQNRLDNVLGRDHAGWFAPQQGAKDVRLAVELARSGGVTLPLAGLVAKRFEEAGQSYADDDVAAVVELLRSAERRP